MTSVLPISVGRSVGWRIKFPDLPLEIGHDGFYAKIDLLMNSGLNGGSFSIEIDRLGSDDFSKLADARKVPKKGGTRPAIKADLTLFWRDKLGDTPNALMAPITSRVAITTISRRSEGSQIITTLEGRDQVFDLLAHGTYEAPVDAEKPKGIDEAISILCDAAGVNTDAFELRFPEPAFAKTSENIDLLPGAVLKQLAALGNRLSEQAKCYGRGAYLIRDGILYAGLARPIPFADGLSPSSPIDVSPDTGRVSIDGLGQQSLSEAVKKYASVENRPIEYRDEYLVTAAGRPDIKPGDVIKTKVSKSEAADIGGFGLPPIPGIEESHEITLYVNSVRHSLGKNVGWLTKITGVTVDLNNGQAGIWDLAIPQEANEQDGANPDGAEANPANNIVTHVRKVARELVRDKARPRIGELRRKIEKTTMDGDVVSSAAQSTSLLFGLEAPDGNPRRARRQLIDRDNPAIENVPCLTPFAWGSFGQVLPHYPGERVLVTHHEDDAQDPVVLGSFWQTHDDAAHNAPQNVEIGDWWLILPVDAPTTVVEQEPHTPPENIKAVHDLIDASGKRIIENGEITIRVAEPGTLKGADTRPGSDADGGVVIEHTNGSRIHMDKNGDLTITTGGNLNLKADGNINLTASAIEMTADSVNVK